MNGTARRCWQQTAETAQRVGLVEKAPAAKDLFVPGLEK